MEPFKKVTAINNNLSRTPYLHQREAIAALNTLNKLNSYSTLLVLPTGGGNKNIWRIFFVDKRYFLKMVEIELTKLAHPEIYAAYQKKSTTTVEPPPPVTDFKAIDDMIHELEEEISYNKLAVKEKILAALSEIEENAQKNRDADKMNKIAVRYRKIHEHANSARCDSIATLYRLSS